jgi:hypothetical protein
LPKFLPFGAGKGDAAGAHMPAQSQAVTVVRLPKGQFWPKVDFEAISVKQNRKSGA